MKVEVTNKVTIGEVSRKLDKHIEKQDEFEEYLKARIEDLNLILKVFKWLGWAITVASGAAIVWFVEHFLGKR